MDKAASRIPSFLLYGETADGREPPFIHIESIAARSRSLDWEIKPHRHDALAHILLIRALGGRFLLDGVWHHLGPGSVISVPSKLVHGFSFLPETDGVVVTFSDSLRGLARDGLIEADLGADLSRAMLVNFSDDRGGFERISQSLNCLQTELSEPRIGQLSAIRSHMALILLTLLRTEGLREPPCSSQDQALVDRLRHKVGLSGTRQVSVGDYAADLGVTPARLNGACRRVAGCSTLHLLHAAQLAEAKRALLYTAMPINEIAYSLGFDDPAYFSRFFLRHAGRTPTAFRALHIPI